MLKREPSAIFKAKSNPAVYTLASQLLLVALEDSYDWPESVAKVTDLGDIYCICAKSLMGNEEFATQYEIVHTNYSLVYKSIQKYPKVYKSVPKVCKEILQTLTWTKQLM